MSDATPAKKPLRASQYATLRRLFLLLFLRGHTAQRLNKDSAPQSLIQKLALLLLTYALLGLMAIGFSFLPIAAMATYMHAATFIFVSMFMASAAGPVLFNREESDILMHRPIDPQILLRAKIAVLIEAALLIALAFNVGCLVTGMINKDGGVLFAVAHIVSLALEAIFCAGLVVMSYQLCLKWCGRERLDSVITTVQVLLTMFLVGGSQLLPRFAIANAGSISLSLGSWWILLVPPAWFAGVDMLVCGSFGPLAIVSTIIAVTATFSVLWLAFVRLANDYQTGLQRIGETVSVRPGRSSSLKWISLLTSLTPVRWWLRDPVERSAFTLTIAYIMRDRDIKLRLYPSIAPVLMMPLASLFQQRNGSSSIETVIGLTAGSSMLSMIPALCISQMTISQNWQAAELFRVAPLTGPARLCHGLRRAILVVFTLPALTVYGLFTLMATDTTTAVALMMPNLIAIPTLAIVSSWISCYPPLSRPVEESKGAWQVISVFGMVMAGFCISAIACAAWLNELFIVFLVAEAIVSGCVYFAFHRMLSAYRWPLVD